MPDRSFYLDCVKGIAVLSIVFIHTVWWSGSAYVPTTVRSLSLLVDVPLFFFLSGWSFAFVDNVHRGVKNLVRLQVRYLWYICLLALVIVSTSQSIDTSTVFHWIFHRYDPSPPLVVAMGSMWFIKTYMVVSLFCMIVVANLDATEINWVGLFAACAVFSRNDQLNVTVLGEPWGAVLCYGFLFLMGYQWGLHRIGPRHIVALMVLAIGYLLCTLPLAVPNLQDLKFPSPDPIYLCCSMLSIGLTSLGARKFENLARRLTWFRYVGQHAIFFFFAQGISSSLLYFIVPHLPFHYWVPTLILAFGLNLITAAFIAWVLGYLYQWSERGVRYVVA